MESTNKYAIIKYLGSEELSTLSIAKDQSAKMEEIALDSGNGWSQHLMKQILEQ